MINTLETDKNKLPVIGFKQCLIDTLVDCIVNIWVIVATELKKKKHMMFTTNYIPDFHVCSIVVIWMDVMRCFYSSNKM